MATETERRPAKDALFDGFARIAAALGSGRRAEIVEVLAQGERSVEEVAQAIGQSMANASHHLRTLARAGLVYHRREGTRVYYRIASTTVLDVWLSMRVLTAEQLADFDRLAQGYIGDRNDIEVVGLDELNEMIASGEVVLLDVRPDVEYAAGHLPGARSAPIDQFPAVIDSLPADREVVAYCRGPYCVYADDAIRHLVARGRKARRYEEGVPEWRRAGRPIEVGSRSQ